ncbi:DMT family transporter [Leptolyngbya sp. FACHB-261]|uniref:DMT family transporter n=1 Tax=Leptolyngbya sp. FACHB-261 TaxID=2692806 RepID=UPI001685D4FA|nr:DMT family transporter [Leptolyngbya sp. FACHB-261]MBD2102094.1 DMT family transporter [Leptolyngbya sp. FACHB-261]
MTLHHSSGRWRLGLALSLLTVVLWGILPITLKVTLQALDVYTVTWFRFLVSFALLALYLGLRQQLPKLATLRATPLNLLVIATVSLALNYLLYLEGLNQTTAANAQVLIQLAPVLLGLGALTIFKERYTQWQWLGLGTLAAGLVLFFDEQLRTLVTAPQQYLWGSGLILLAAAIWTVYALAQKQLLQKLPSAVIMLAIYGGSALLFSPVASPLQIGSLSPLHLSMLLLCALNTLMAYGAFAEALEHWEASRVSAVLSLTPLVTLGAVFTVDLIWPTLMPPEPLTVLGLTGAVLVVVGSLGIALGRSSKAVKG